MSAIQSQGQRVPGFWQRIKESIEELGVSNEELTARRIGELEAQVDRLLESEKARSESKR